MSHLHSVAGQSRISAEYKAYLEQVRIAAQRKAEQDEKVRKKTRAKTFESYLNQERDAAENSHQNPGRDPKTDSESSSENHYA